MVSSSDVSRDDERGTLLVRLPADALALEDGEAFTRADLVFSGVAHTSNSYDVRVFLNNPQATVDTPRAPDEGYAGRFVVFGHGGCFGGTGHCDPPPQARGPYDLRLPHQLTPHTKLVTITAAVRRLVADGSPEEVSVTLVPVVRAGDGDHAAPELFTYEDMELRTYLSEDEDEDAFISS